MDREESVVLKWVSTVDTAQQAARDHRQPAEGGRVTATAGTRRRPSTVRAHSPQSTCTFFFFFNRCTSTTVYRHCRYPVPFAHQPQSAATAGTRCSSASHCRYPVFVSQSLPVPGVRQPQRTKRRRQFVEAADLTLVPLSAACLLKLSGCGVAEPLPHGTYKTITDT